MVTDWTAQTADEWKEVATENIISKSLLQVREHVRQVIEGERLAMFVFGGAGLGKNYIVMSELARHGFHDIKPITPASNNDLLREFHNATYKRQRRPLPLVFDEARLIFETQPNMNTMKLALDGGKGAKRWDSGYIWYETVSVTDEETGECRTKKIRHQGTSLAAPVIAMTNKNLHEFDKKMHDHAVALMSRVPPIMIPDDVIATWEYVTYLALTSDIISNFKGRSLPLSLRSAVLDWFTDNVHNLANVSVRTLEKIRDDFAVSKLLEADLSLHLKPEEKRTGKPGPIKQDWAALRRVLT